MSTIDDYSYVYDVYDIKREQVYNRDKEDIEHEKQLVNSNRFLSATFLKKRNSRFERYLNSNEQIAGDSNTTRNDDDDGDKKHTYCYLCSIGAHVHEKTKPVPVSKRRYLKKYIDLSQWLKKIGDDESLLYDLDYTFKIKIGSNKYAGTNSNIFFSINGSQGDWPKTEIKKAKSLKHMKFPSDSELTFHINGPMIGELSRLKIWHDAISATDGLFLEYVEISCLELNRTWMFVCNRWLSKHRPPDYKRVVFLYPGDGLEKPGRSPVASRIAGSDYFIIIKTDNKMLSGTDANVTFQIKGSLGLSETFPLQTKNVNLFEKSQIDAFMLESAADIGEPGAIKLTHDSKKFASDWRIKEIKIVYSGKSNHYYSFPFEKWLDKENKFSAVIKCKEEQQVSARDPSSSGSMVYFVTVFTGKARNAGTDANVFVEIGGSMGKTQPRKLDNNSNNKFEKGKIDHFTFIDADVGDIRFVRIWHDNSGVGPGFFLDKVLLKCQRTVITNASEPQSEDLFENLQDVKYKIKFITSPLTKKLLEAKNQRSRSMPRQKGRTKSRSPKPIKRSKSVDSKSIRSRSTSTVSVRSILKTPNSPRNRHRSVKFDPRAEPSIKNEKGEQQVKATTTSKMHWILTTIQENSKLKSIKRLDMFDRRLQEIDDNELKRFKTEYKKIEGTVEGSINKKTTESEDSTSNRIYVFECNQWLAKDEGDRRIERILKLTEIIKQKN